MGKRLKIIIISIIILLIPFNCYAVPDTNEMLDDFLSGAPSDFSEIDEIEDVSKLIDVNSTLHIVFDMFSKHMKNCTSVFISYLAIILLFSFVENIEFKQKNSYRNIISAVASISVITISFIPLSKNIELISEAVDTMKVFTSTAVPVVVTLSISSGESFSAALFSTAVSFASAAFEYITDNLMLPLVVVYIITGAVSNFSNQYGIGNIGGYIKKFIKWIIGIFIGIFTVSISLQSFLTKASDNVTKKIIKSAVGGFIPIIGTTLSGNVDNIFALCASSKTAFAILGVIIITVIFLPVIIGNICFGSVAWLSEFIASFAGVNSIKRVLSSIAETFYILTAICSVGVYMVIISYLLICINIS